MRLIAESEKIRRSLNPIFISSWIFGVPRISYKYTHRLMYSVLIAAIFAATFIVSLDVRWNAAMSYNHTYATFYGVSQIVTFVGGIGTIIFWVASGAKALDDSIVELGTVDVELRDIGIEVKHRDVYRRQIRLLGSFSTIWLVIIGLHEYIFTAIGINDKSLILKTCCLSYSSHVPHLITLFSDLVFSTIMFTFYERFQLINRALTEIAKDREQSNDGIIAVPSIQPLRNRRDLPFSNKVNRNLQESLERIDRLYKVHRQLYLITEKLSVNFSWQLYFTVSTTFCLLVYRLLALYTLVFVPLSVLGSRIGLSLLWVFYLMLKFWVITLSCCNTITEANTLGIILYRITIDSESFHRMLHRYSAHLLQNELRITVGGFFTIDKSLVGTLFSCVTTYMIFAVNVWKDTEANSAESTTVSS
ncbi:putative gustatory receptor 28b [Neodiprion pinetum]|uniref:Gustatory receptor n=1 Tax=Neodiprion lecontei TaxID=441921 RepID=A0A6J0BVU5_NEOLC|nr:putative gustatory receptor 28b [Neodiprion lecontei]XP_046465308.1 putative gustatory receptor 28b [Neodiprion pinetum]